MRPRTPDGTLVTCYRGHAPRLVRTTCKECVKITNAQYHKEHATEIIERKQGRVAQDPEAARAKWRMYDAKRDKEKKRIIYRNCYRKNPIAYRALANNRRARIANAPGSFGGEEIANLLRKQKYKCAACFDDIKSNSHADHIVPLFLGGTNFIENIQMLCPTCNSSKGHKDPIAWANLQGRLL